MMGGMWIGMIFVWIFWPANRCSPKFQRKRSRISRLAGFLPFIWSNLCTRYILDKLTPRGHEDWPDKRRRVEKIGTRPFHVPEPRSVAPNSVQSSTPDNLQSDRRSHSSSSCAFWFVDSGRQLFRRRLALPGLGTWEWARHQFFRCPGSRVKRQCRSMYARVVWFFHTGSECNLRIKPHRIWLWRFRTQNHRSDVPAPHFYGNDKGRTWSQSNPATPRTYAKQFRK